MVSKDKLKDFLFEIFDEIIKFDFSNDEKNEWDKCLNYFNIDLHQFLNILLDNIEIKNISRNNNVSLSDAAKKDAEPFVNELFKNVKRRNLKIEKNFNTLNYRLNLIFNFKIKEMLEKVNIENPDFDKEIQYSSLKFNRFGFPRELEFSNFPSMRTFIAIDKHKAYLNITSLRTQLINEYFLDNETIDNDSFEAIFNKKSINKKFVKINWLGSIYELKEFINILFDKDVITKDLNYYFTIIDCFLIKGTNIEFSQLKNPRGSSKRIELLENIISNSIVKI